MSFSLVTRKLVVQKYNLDHNHVLAIMQHYTSVRHLSESQQEEVQDILKLAPKVKLFKEHVCNKFWKTSHSPGSQNIHGKLKEQKEKGHNDAQVMLDHLEKSCRKMLVQREVFLWTKRISCQ